jgi:hypothetical protein
LAVWLLTQHINIKELYYYYYYYLLYNILSTFDLSCVYVTTSVDSAVACLNAAVQDAMEHTIPRGVTNANSKFPHWYSNTLKKTPWF